ncbi:MAG: hypothetical protein A2513_03695 [Sulfurimonas sp. RIFOXYD12_FULL_33_39]|uniref:DUF3817 domain-containing protein n=1 Tax=unclassified Sulfurimonas TaxID=2623549 RepID=UPI0008B2C30F|nr:MULTISPECIES: DUF3817 domain-containing protein [unclassified Sulfurimonas]OHE06732.1 MAG: hypothetical protein A3G74_00420 [Sulfurimonas sp. RIFCSPLOWO2_12_FULL_34_6]OHE09243.1 MAG: hypothetical protein A2513_03695 [Sulfurimonas sp. RIFOXYD12_FULL_33_39]OHE12974.1 MAG: hypothetical protein A2530_05110 [Sulfurimonas sp. RIFOXYD2_FULL_34_21]
MKNVNVTRFAEINTIEGYSYLILLFIAMPMKYFFGIPLAVKIVGMIHGILFIMFCYYLIKAWGEAKWSIKRSTVFFIASLVPFGTFFTKDKIKTYELKSLI